AVAAPRMDYASSIWHRPNDSRVPTIKQLHKISTIQRQIMNMIIGCIKTTPTIVLEIETALPLQLRLCSKILRIVTRMQCPSIQHPICPTCSQKWTRAPSRIKSGKSHQTEHTLINHEEIHPFIRPPWW